MVSQKKTAANRRNAKDYRKGYLRYTVQCPHARNPVGASAYSNWRREGRSQGVPTFQRCNSRRFGSLRRHGGTHGGGSHWIVVAIAARARARMRGHQQTVGRRSHGGGRKETNRDGWPHDENYNGAIGAEKRICRPAHRCRFGYSSAPRGFYLEPNL